MPVVCLMTNVSSFNFVSTYYYYSAVPSQSVQANPWDDIFALLCFHQMNIFQASPLSDCHLPCRTKEFEELLQQEVIDYTELARKCFQGKQVYFYISTASSTKDRSAALSCSSSWYSEILWSQQQF